MLPFNSTVVLLKVIVCKLVLVLLRKKTHSSKSSFGYSKNEYWPSKGGIIIRSKLKQRIVLIRVCIMKNGKPVKVLFTLPIVFKLES